VGGELVASAIYTAESAPPALRATFGSSVFLGIIGGICMGYAVASLALAASAPFLLRWGVFRLPFLSGEETAGWVAARSTSRTSHVTPHSSHLTPHTSHALQG
jgi:hypothetical protein